MSAPVVDIPAAIPEQSTEDRELVNALVAYKREATNNRKGGLNPRDDKWQQNLDLYWNRYDFSDKAAWQSKNVMPEVPSYVDRFASAMKDALVATPNGFYTVQDPYDTEDDLTPVIKKANDVWLTTAGKNQLGTPVDFSTVFEEQCKMGALMAMSAVVKWEKDVTGGRVSVESIDPRHVWLDHTYRNLYRIRRTEVDMIDIARMTGEKSSKGKQIYNLDEISRLVSGRVADLNDRKELTGTGEETMSDRKPIILDEYLASVVDKTGKIIMDKEVCVIADDSYMIRGPEKNPFWHGNDWMVYTPLMPVPLSPYGRTYMEDFGAMAKVFTDLTNLILDATYMASMKAYVLVPDMLKDPSQINSGIFPNKIFHLQDGYNVADFAKALELGTLDQGSVQMWEAIKSELTDASGMNEVGLGQLPDKTHIAATAVAGAQQSSSATIRSVAQTIETRFLDPMLDLVWKTGLQNVSPSDIRMANAVGMDMWGSLLKNRRELIKHPITFQARGISALIQKQQKLQALMGVLQVIAQNQNLMAAFMQRIDINRFIDLLFKLSNVDIRDMEQSGRDQLVQALQGQLYTVNQNAQQGNGGQAPSPPAMQQMGDLATQMGVAR